MLCGSHCITSCNRQPHILCPVMYNHLALRVEGARLPARMQELFGPLSMRALEEDKYVRQIEGYLPYAKVAFIDEIFKANSAILNTLLTILNERLFDNGSSRIRVPLICLVGGPPDRCSTWTSYKGRPSGSCVDVWRSRAINVMLTSSVRYGCALLLGIVVRERLSYNTIYTWYSQSALSHLTELVIVHWSAGPCATCPCNNKRALWVMHRTNLTGKDCPAL